MKFLLIAVCAIAAVAATSPSSEYLPPVQEAPSNEYLPPTQEAQPQIQYAAAPAQVQVQEAAPAHALADDGYRYKTHRRVVYRRHRRDVSNEYLPPVQEAAPVQAPSVDYLPPTQAAQPQVQYSAPAPVAVQVQESAPAHVLADDGYRYKTHRRVVYRRHRRDVSHLPSNEYLPPVQEAAPVQAPSVDYLPPTQAAQPQVQYSAPAPVAVQVQESAPAHVLADDGYRYKTHRRVVYRRHRRDVSNEYLPPVQEAAPAQAPSVDYLPPTQAAQPQVQYSAPAPVAVQVQESAPAHVLADDGYRYKTHRRVVYRRHRRDVSHLPSNEYLPPVQESAPAQEYVAQAPAPAQIQYQAAPVAVEVQESAPAHVLADDGYRYKTHRRVVYRRHRRDVSHLPSNEYLPPVQESAPAQEYIAPAPAQAQIQYQSAPVEVQEAAPAHVLADDGYRYKTHRRVVYRRRY